MRFKSTKEYVPKHVAEYLWEIIDDIDTTSDYWKSDDACFRKDVDTLQMRRWEVGSTEGFVVTFNGEVKAGGANVYNYYNLRSMLVSGILIGFGLAGFFRWMGWIGTVPVLILVALMLWYERKAHRSFKLEMEAAESARELAEDDE